MKVRMNFKMPDVVDDAVRETVDAEMLKGDIGPEVDSYDLRFEARRVCEKFVKHGEYVTIEVDTETGKAEVLPA